MIVQEGFETNVADGGGNAVTWGVFPGQEIAQPTIIDRDSFLAWKVRHLEFSNLSDSYALRKGRRIYDLERLWIMLPP